MCKAKRLFILLLFSGVIAMIFACGKKNQAGDYGVSISAPKLVGTPAEAFSAEDINTLKLTNAFEFLLLNQTDSLTSFSFSPISVVRYVFDVADSGYVASFRSRFSLQDTNSLFESISSIKDIIKSIDSTIDIESQEHILKDSTVVINQKFNFPLIYKDALHTSHNTFNCPPISVKKRGKVVQKEQTKKLEFFTLVNNFSIYQNDKVLVCDIPIGNGNYSLMLVQAKQMDMLSFVKTFSEQDFKNIIDKLEEKYLQISFPNISQKTSCNLSLPTLSFDTVYKMPSIVIHSKVRVKKPLEEELKMLSSQNQDQDMVQSSPQSYSFDKPFLFLIRGKSSNSIILSGVFCGF